MRTFPGLLLVTVLFWNTAYAQNYYQVLGVKPSATAGEIKRTFRTLAKKYHPDKSQTGANADQFMKIRQAYEVLGNVKSRQQYDNKLKFQSATFNFRGGFFRDKAKKTAEDNDPESFFGADFPFTDIFNMFMESFKSTENPQRHSERTRQSSSEESESASSNDLTKFIVKNILKALKTESGKERGPRSARTDNKESSTFTGGLFRAYESCLGSRAGFPYWSCVKDVFRLFA